VINRRSSAFIAARQAALTADGSGAEFLRNPLSDYLQSYIDVIANTRAIAGLAVLDRFDQVVAYVVLQVLV
jgi:hypothetical protein